MPNDAAAAVRVVSQSIYSNESEYCQTALHCSSLTLNFYFNLKELYFVISTDTICLLLSALAFA